MFKYYAHRSDMLPSPHEDRNPEVCATKGRIGRTIRASSIQITSEIVLFFLIRDNMLHLSPIIVQEKLLSWEFKNPMGNGHYYRTFDSQMMP